MSLELLLSADIVLELRTLCGDRPVDLSRPWEHWIFFRSKGASMLKSVFCVTLALGAATLVGCKEDETKTATPPASAPPTTLPAVPEVPTAPAATQPAAEVTPPVAPAVPAVPAAPAAPAVTPPATPEAPAAAAPGAAAANPEAQTLLSQVEDDIKNKNWDDASAVLKKLVAMKDQLPQSVQDQIANLQKTVDAGKLGSGLGIPGLGK